MAWRPAPVARALSGAAALAVAMGIGRFAYTALLPGLQRGLAIDDAAGGALASANLAGYLLGAIWARRAAGGRSRTALLRAGLAASVLASGAVVGASSLAAWGLLRVAAGVASGLVFVLVSAAVLDELPPGSDGLAGLLYAGVGGGIALSGAVAAATRAVGWRVPWAILAALAALLALPGLAMSPSRAARQDPAPTPAPAAPGGQVSISRLSVAYFLEGLGYIVSGTFAVAAVQRTPGLEPLAPWVWVAAGLAAVPSAIAWGAVARRIGAVECLAAALALQAAGMALPAFSAGAWSALAGALLFGGTFMGITTVTIALGRRLSPRAPGRAIGTLTVVFGVGQAIGPALAGLLARETGSPRPAVLCASAAVALGALLLWRGRSATAARPALFPAGRPDPSDP